MSVSAVGALGLRITRVRYDTRQARTAKRFSVLVTVRDLRGRLVRDAIVSIGRVPGATATLSHERSGFSNRLGQARVVVPVSSKLLGKRVNVKIAARTPSSRAMVLGSVRMPRGR